MATERDQLNSTGEPARDGKQAKEALADKKAAATAAKAQAGEEILDEHATRRQKANDLRALDDDQLLALAEEATKADHWLNVARRSQADADNTLKRVRREHEENQKYAATPLARELLPVLDNLQRAVTAAAAAKDFASLQAGVELTQKMFVDALARMSIKPIECMGKPFDPALHEALMMVNNSALDENAVAQELERGWRLHDRVLRAAKVAVNRKQ